MGPTRIAMSLLPYTSPYARYGYGYGYGAPYGAYGGYGPGFYGAGYPYGPYGMTAEEIQKVREAEERPSTMPKLSARSSWRRRKRSTRSLLLLRRRGMRTMCLPKRRLSRMPSQRRRSSQRSLDRLWPIWPSRRFRWIRLRLWLPWLLPPIWLWSIWAPILLDECSSAMRCVEHNVMLRSARSMELS